jgi:hypothetical protein
MDADGMTTREIHGEAKSQARGASRSHIGCSIIGIIVPNLDVHDPVVVYVIIFLLSLLAAYVLFKVLDSRAAIKKKNGAPVGQSLASY